MAAFHGLLREAGPPSGDQLPGLPSSMLFSAVALKEAKETFAGLQDFSRPGNGVWEAAALQNSALQERSLTLKRFLAGVKAGVGASSWTNKGVWGAAAPWNCSPSYKHSLNPRKCPACLQASPSSGRASYRHSF